jgi:hypothetical protein
MQTWCLLGVDDRVQAEQFSQRPGLEGTATRRMWGIAISNLGDMPETGRLKVLA